MLQYKSIDKGKISLLVMLDLSKPLISVNNDLLLNKLVQVNIDSMWFASYLHDRTHSVKIDKITSEYLVQSSLTFFINDIPKIN